MTVSWSTPWPEVTPLLRLRSGGLSAVTSLSTVGKSTFALNVAAHNAFAGHGTVFGSAESEPLEVMEMIMAATLGLDVRKFGLPRAEAEEFAARLKRVPMVMVDTDHSGRKQMADFERSIMNLTDRGEPSALAVVDTIQGFSEPGSTKSVARNMEILRRFADDYSVAVLVVTRLRQPSRGQPGMEDVPAEVAAVADTVVSLHRPIRYWDPTTSTSPVTTLKVIKGSGLGNTTQLLLQGPYCRFVTMEGGS